MATAPALNQTTNGTIAQVIGAVVDVTFEGELPAILSAAMAVPDFLLGKWTGLDVQQVKQDTNVAFRWIVDGEESHDDAENR